MDPSDRAALGALIDAVSATLERIDELGASLRGTHRAIVEWGHALDARADAAHTVAIETRDAVRELRVAVRSLGEFVHAGLERQARVEEDVSRLTAEVALLAAWRARQGEHHDPP